MKVNNGDKLLTAVMGFGLTFFVIWMIWPAFGLGVLAPPALLGPASLTGAVAGFFYAQRIKDWLDR